MSKKGQLAKQKLCIYIKLKYEKCIYKDLNKIQKPLYTRNK